MTRSFLWALIASMAWVQALSADQPAPSRFLRLKSATIDTDSRVNLLDVDNRPNQFDQKRYVLQLDAPVTAGQRHQLAVAGAILGDYLPDYAYVVDLAAADPAKFAELGFVRFVGQFDNAWKIDPQIGARLTPFQTPQRIAIAQRGEYKLVVTVFDAGDIQSATDQLAAAGATVLGSDVVGDGGEIYATAAPTAIPAIAAIDAVQFVEQAPEITYRNNTTRWIIQSNVSNNTPIYANGIIGTGQIVGILDGRPNQNHCSLDGGKILAYNSSSGSDTHGTHVSGTAVGDNGSNDNLRGIAYGANMVFNTIPSFTESGITQRLNLHHSQGARLHTNSWGDDGTTSYNSLARGFDSFLYDNEEDFVCLAVTNTSTLRNPENAKNLLAIGASQDTPSQANHCSGGIGPTADGRRKPEVYAPGCSTTSASAFSACGTTSLTGTSMASPAVAGAAALVRQYFVDGYYPTGTATPADAWVPSGALIKAVLINGSVDMTGVSGYPSNREGWGRLRADDALFFPGDARKLVLMDDIRNPAGLSTSEFEEYPLVVNSSTEQLRVTLSFTDAPASAGTGSGNAAVNDLDLEVVDPGGTLYRGNFFSAGASASGGSADTKNNVEQVHITSPAIGNWTVRVRATAVNQGTQGYALIATGDVVGMAPPLTVHVVDEVPEVLPPGADLDLSVQIIEGDQQLVAGSQMFFYRYGGGSFQSALLTPLGGELYNAALPTVQCGDTPEFFVSAAGNGGATITDPADAPTSLYSISVGTLTVLFDDDMENDLGWKESSTATDGLWERGIPVNALRGDPATAHGGSGTCYVTGNAIGVSDVANGVTQLTSQPVDMSSGGSISYAYWLGDMPTSPLSPEDSLSVEVATDANGTNWTTLRTHTSAQALWRTDTIDITSEVGASSTVRIRFGAADLGSQNVVEAAIDSVVARNVICNPPGDGDFDLDGDRDLYDYSQWQLCADKTPAIAPCNVADMVGDGEIDDADYGAFEQAVSGP